MIWTLCAHCGARWTDADREASHYFTSLSYPLTDSLDGDTRVVSAADIIALGETILTCPLDARKNPESLGYAEDSFSPSGASMSTGDDRFTSGDETDPRRHEVTPVYPPIATRHPRPE